ncbi:MAG: hypothetical protein QM581_11675, partial [Pseudomonas sp.]
MSEPRPDPFDYADIRPTDRNRPIDTLPSPFGHGPAADGPQRLPGYSSELTCYQPIWFSLKPDLGRERREAFHQQVFEALRECATRHAPVESGRDGSPAAMLPLAQIRRDICQHPEQTLFVFRSRDARWAGFRFGEQSLRFPLEELIGLSVDIALPARGGGYADIGMVFRRGIPYGDSQYHLSSFTLPTLLNWHADTRLKLLHAFIQVAALLDVRIHSRLYNDC